MQTALLLAALVAGLALAAPVAMAATTNVAVSGPADARFACSPGIPWPVTIVCGIVGDLCDDTKLCE